MHAYSREWKLYTTQFPGTSIGAFCSINDCSQRFAWLGLFCPLSYEHCPVVYGLAYLVKTQSLGKIQMPHENSS